MAAKRRASVVAHEKRMAKARNKVSRKICGRTYGTLNSTTLRILGLCGAIYIALMTFLPLGTIGDIGGCLSESDLCEGSDRCIVDPASDARTEEGIILWKGAIRPIVAESPLQMVCLAISRCSAFFIYPSLVLVFVTKFRATMELVAQSPFGMFVTHDLHDLHVLCGWLCVIDGAIHTTLHCTRWLLQGNIILLVQSRSGASGIVCLLCMFIIGLPMGWEVLRSRIAYEYRRYAHYLFVVYCIAMAFHAPFSSFPNGGFAPLVFPILICWWALDSFYVYFRMTEMIKTSTFHVLPSGVQLTMPVSERFQSVAGDGGYCYVNLPWISRTQWHAYSLFENPANPAERQIFMMKLGDWTTDVLEALQRDTCRPVWVCGPFTSPYDNAAMADNQILVAGGIGITPALSVMRKHSKSRRPNLIWACRDPHMLEFFCKNAEFSRRGWNMIFYTGKAGLYIGDANQIITKNGAIVHIVRARPNLSSLISNIIFSIESGKYVPEDFVTDTKAETILSLQEKLVQLNEMDLTCEEKMNELRNYSNELGFLFTDLMSEIMGADPCDVDKDDPGLDEKGQEKKSEGSEDRKTAMLKKLSTYAFDQNASTQKVRARGRRASIVRRRAPLGKDANAVVLDQIEAGMDTWMDANAYRPWVEDSSESNDYVKGLDPDVLETWGALYCGGQGPLANNLKEACKDFGISLEMESFKW